MQKKEKKKKKEIRWVIQDANQTRQKHKPLKPCYKQQEVEIK